MISTGFGPRLIQERIDEHQQRVKYRHDLYEEDLHRADELDNKLRYTNGQTRLELLAKAGLDQVGLEAKIREKSKLLQQQLEQFKQSPPSERLVSLRELRRQEFALRQGLTLPSVPTQFLASPPAAGCATTVEEDLFCDATLAEIKMQTISTGLGGSSGFGAFATPPPKWGGIYYYFIPPSDGLLFVNAFVDIEGNIYASSDDGLLTSSYAKVSLTLGCDLWQLYSPGINFLTVVDESRENSSTLYEVSDIFQISNRVNVYAGLITMIWVEASLSVIGRSSSALASADFLTGENHIKVPLVEFLLFS